MGFALKGRFFFGVLILLITLVLMVIGYLANLLFSLDPIDIARRPGPSYQLAGVPYGATNMAMSETFVTVGGPAEPRPLITATARVAVVTDAPVGGVIPTICDMYGPEVRTREAYRGPVTHWADVAPDRVVFHLNTGADKPKERGSKP